MSAEAALDRFADAVVYRAECETPYMDGADREVHEAREALRALLATEEAREWMPIETAPKDGTEILAYWSGGKTYSIVLWSVADGWWMEESDRAMVSPPTHWKHLEPPLSVSGKRD